MRNLRRIRENKSLSLRDVGADLDVNYSLVSYWERGIRNPSERNIIKLEEYFELPIEYLLEDDEHVNHPGTVSYVN